MSQFLPRNFLCVTSRSLICILHDAMTKVYSPQIMSRLLIFFPAVTWLSCVHTVRAKGRVTGIKLSVNAVVYSIWKQHFHLLTVLYILKVTKCVTLLDFNISCSSTADKLSITVPEQSRNGDLKHVALTTSLCSPCRWIWREVGVMCL